MELLKNVNEMTMISGGLNQDIIDNIFKKLVNGEYIGDIDGYKILRKNFGDTIAIGLDDNDILVSFITYSKSDINDNIMILGLGFTKPEFRNKNHVKRILWFLKNIEKLSFIDSGINTEDGINFYKALSNSERFDMYWFNIKSKEKIKYDGDIDNKQNKPFRDISKKTKWRILIEGDMNSESIPRWWWRAGNDVDMKKFNAFYIFEKIK